MHAQLNAPVTCNAPCEGTHCSAYQQRVHNIGTSCKTYIAQRSIRRLSACAVQDKLVKTIVANYILWPGAHFINFRFVPSEHRILYNNCVSVRFPFETPESSFCHPARLDPGRIYAEKPSCNCCF